VRKWIKLWVKESLIGTIRFDFTPAERGVWFDLLALAGNSRFDGVIAPGEGSKYPHPWIAATLDIPLELLEQTLEKCQQSRRIIEDADGIHIVNWTKYQSEYQRQKPYRQKEKPPQTGETDPYTAALARNYHAEIGIPTATIEQELAAWASQLKKANAPREWIHDAFKEAAINNVPNWNYVKAILNSWLEQGKERGENNSPVPTTSPALQIPNEDD